MKKTSAMWYKYTSPIFPKTVSDTIFQRREREREKERERKREREREREGGRKSVNLGM